MYEYEKKRNETKGRERMKRNDTGIPVQLKRRVEDSTGFSLDDVRVSYHSGRPANLDASAYTQGNQVYIGPGQERYLPHELGHVIQQKMGIVRAGTRHTSGVMMNTDAVLEKQADEIGRGLAGYAGLQQKSASDTPVQRNPLQQDKNKKDIGGLSQTAHHIIPRSWLLEKYDTLEDEKKETIEELSGANRGFVEDAEPQSYIEWPQGNIFYGPNTSIRAEPGEKDEFDYDARFMSRVKRENFRKLKEYYENVEKALKDIEDSKKLIAELNKQRKNIAKILKKSGKTDGLSSQEKAEKQGKMEARLQEIEAEQQRSEALIEKNKQIIVDTLKEIYTLTALKKEGETVSLQTAAPFTESDWMEVTGDNMLQMIKGHRENIMEYTYFKIPDNQIGEGKIYEKIEYKSGGFKYTDEGASFDVPVTPTSGRYFYIKCEVSSKNPKILVDYLEQKGAPKATYLPKGLVDYIYALEGMMVFREKIAQPGHQALIYETKGLITEMSHIDRGDNGEIDYERLIQDCMSTSGWEREYFKEWRKPVRLDNKDLESQAEKLLKECEVVISDYGKTKGYYNTVDGMIVGMLSSIREEKARLDTKTGKESVSSAQDEQDREKREWLSGAEGSLAAIRKRLGVIKAARLEQQERNLETARGLAAVFSRYV